MSIGKQIKTRRKELNMSQDQLAQKIGVSRSAVSNWEIERNYPDLQLIVSLSETLNLSLDSLLKEDCNVVEKIANDTLQRYKLSKKIIILYIVTALLIVFIGVILYNTRYQNIYSAKQIESIKVENDLIKVSANIPCYRSLELYYIDRKSDSRTLNITLTTKRDLLFTNKSDIEIPLNEWKNIDTVIFIDSNNNPIKEVKL